MRSATPRGAQETVPTKVLGVVGGPQASGGFAAQLGGCRDDSYVNLLAATGEEQRATLVEHGFGVDDTLADVTSAGDVVHHFHEGLFEHRAEAAGTGLMFN